MAEIVIQYSTSPAWQSTIIRRMSHSPWSHVDIVLPGEGLLGASGPDDSLNDPGGVLVRPFEAWPYLRPPKCAHIQIRRTAVGEAIIAAARSQIGKPFDHSALWHFIDDPSKSERDWRSKESWFCSELVVWACETGGLFPWTLCMPKDRVTPGDSLMLFNPFLPPENVLEMMEP